MLGGSKGERVNGSGGANGNGMNGEKKKKKKGRKNPMTQIFWLLWPFNKSKKDLANDPDATAGQLELVAIFTISVLRTWHQNRMVYIKRDLMEATYKRNNTMFSRIIQETVVLSVLSSMIFAAHRYLKERLTLVWREKLTKQLHRRYFHAMNYYKISHLNQSKINDVEERMTKDPRRFCKGLADEMEKASAAVTSGIWFTYKLTTISSFPYAVSPLIYFYVAFKISMTLAPNWSKRWRGMLDRKGTYEKSQSRLQTHSEAICAYQGNVQEREIVDGYWHDFLAYCVHFVKDASLFQFVTSALFEYGGHSFAEALIVGKFISASNPAKKALNAARTTNAKMEASANLFSELRFVTEYFIRAMSAQGTIIAVLRQLQNMKGPAKRLTELYDTLEDFDKTRQESTTFKNDMDTIAFENVQVYTPTGHLLVKDLNFSINHGTSMLLTGCNGSGKSSIFRCLGALWKVPEGGSITKPGGNEPGLNASVFYLPQKPYNVLGTLKDQLAYPEFQSKTTAISNDELSTLLHEVDLGYLMDRDHDKEINWEKTLSLGEQQRLAMARLFYHKPRFAILDECTSGVSAAMERRLYEACRDQGITCITISHRPVLEQYHDVVLNILADGKGGWTWRRTAKDKAVAESGESLVGGYSKAYMDAANAGDALLEKQTLEERSRPYKEAALRNPNAKTLAKVDTWKRLKDVLKQLMPQGASMADPEFHRVLFLISLVIGKTILADAIARYDGYILSTVLQNDWGVFARAVVSGAFFRSFLAFFDAQMMRQKWYLNLEWRRRLTEYLMDLYFKKNTFYDIKNHDSRIADPEERITEQVEALSISLTELWTSLLKPAFDITFNTIMLYRTLGLSGVTYTSGYMIGGMLAMRYLVPNFRAIQKKQFELEGRFRFVHNRLIDHTESIAFFGGDDVEHEVVDRRFDQLAKHIRGAQLETFRFNIFNNFTIKQTPDIVAFALRMAYARGYLSDQAVLDDAGGSRISSGGEYIQQTVMRSFRSFGDAFDLQETIGQFIGTLENVTDLMYTLEDLTRDDDHAAREARLVQSSGEIGFDNVDIVAPGEVCVVSNLTVDIEPGKPMIVTGPNAAGKSSLFRTIGGLWPIPKGTIKRPCNEEGVVTPKEVFLVPQKPYSVTGSLADQITYPVKIPKDKRTKEQEEHLLSLMSLVGIQYLVEREGGWDAKAKWEDVLSLGEQQRLGCARLFFHEPKFAVLDECTSAVSVDVEEKLYRAAHDRGITSITISQRLALEEFHNKELKMGDANGKDGWKVRIIEHDD